MIGIRLSLLYPFEDDHRVISLYPSVINSNSSAHLQSSVFKLSKDLIDSIHEEGIVAYTS